MWMQVCKGSHEKKNKMYEAIVSVDWKIVNSCLYEKGMLNVERNKLLMFIAESVTYQSNETTQK